ncbi:MAG: class I SAM-dependent methyltransferase [Planctomycetes bacterium]|nr:class I SAM-dependent methyltransferase [Planctomycetota bacterium]
MSDGGTGDFAQLLAIAVSRRAGLVERLRAEGTDCWRVFHGATEGLPGVAIDRFGALCMVQLFRAASADCDVSALVEATAGHDVGEAIVVVDRRRGPAHVVVHGDHADDEYIAREGGMRCLVRARHAGQDPWLFLDLRAARRALREIAPGRSVLNLFAYTCGAGVAAACAGAREVWNVDFSTNWLAIGARNAELNGVAACQRFLAEAALAVMRQLAGIPVGRRGKVPHHARIERRQFDVVVLDPPRLAHGSFGKIDLVGDYQSLFKPAWLSTAAGGTLIATNNVASVERDSWLRALERCAEKAGRPLRDVQVLAPDADFPSPDGRSPLKVALCQA